uniref:Uncharacterized protein n=1 Tax=Anguilla anguilla TaxID=7936 RepID=A0A0E9WMR2_ANGAN
MLVSAHQRVLATYKTGHVTIYAKREFKTHLLNLSVQ